MCGKRAGRGRNLRAHHALIEALEWRRLLAGAGPDGYGYEANSYPYESLDLVPGAPGVNSILDAEDDGFATVSLGANSFKFYGITYNQVVVNVNGLITMANPSGDTYANGDLTTSPAEATIAPLWDDWRTNEVTSASGDFNDVVLYQIDTTNNRLIVEWNAVRNISGSGSQFATFQAILQLNTGANDGAITFNYPDLDLGSPPLDNGGAATVGIKDAGNQGPNTLLVSYDTNSNPLVQTGAALRITKGTATATGSIAGQAFVDANLNGAIDAGESGVSGATVYLDLNNDGTLGGGEPSTTTDGSGNYSFSGIVDGSYIVRENPPTGVQLVGASNATVMNGSATTGVNLSNYQTIYPGTTGNDSFTLRKQSGQNNLEILAGSGTYLVPSAASASLQFNLGAGDDSLTVDYANGNPLPSAGVLVDGGSDGTSNGDWITINGSAGADAISLYPGTNGAVAGGIAMTNIEHVTVNGNAGNDALTVNSGVGTPIIYNGGADTDSLSYYGSSGNDTITYQMITPASPTISGGGNNVALTGFPEQITVDAMGGDDTIALKSNSPATSVTMLGGSGVDQLQVGNLGNCDDVDGNITWDAGGGPGSLSWSDSAQSANGLVYTITPSSIGRAGTSAINFSQMASLYLQTGSAASTINVTGTASTVSTFITGGIGNNAIVLGPNLDNLAGPVTVSDPGSSDQDTVTLDDSINAFNEAYVVTATEVDRSLFGGLAYSGIEQLILKCQNGNNAITVFSTNALTPVTIFGDNGNDTLTLAGALSSSLIFKGGTLSTDQDALNINSGTYTFNADARNDTANLTVNVASSASAIFNSTQHLAKLTVLGTATMPANGSRYLQARTLSIGSGAKLDLNDNDLIVDNGDFSAIQKLVFQGYRQAADSSATGIISTTGQTAAGNPILALFDNAFIGSGDYPFGSGNTISANAIVGKFTYFGDTNLDGMVTADDYGALDANFGATNVPSGIAWVTGDANFDGVVSADDYGTLDANFGMGVANPLAPAGPAALSITGVYSGLAAEDSPLR